MKSRTLVIAAPGVAIAAIATASVVAQVPPSIDELLTRVGERIAEYYRRAQNVICIERSTVQPIGYNYSPDGFTRTVESELHVEAEGGDVPGEARVVREIRKVNGRLPREKDKKDRDGCTDPNPLSPEPLAFLLPAHRSEYRFTSAGFAKEKNRRAHVIEFASAERGGKVELNEDPKGRRDCYTWSGNVAVKGRVLVDVETYEVLRLEQRYNGPVDVSVSQKVQRQHNFNNWVVIERNDTTIRYKPIAFKEPDEVMLLPEEIQELIVVRGGLQSIRRTQTFADYRRFLTSGRLVKEE